MPKLAGISKNESLCIIVRDQGLDGLASIIIRITAYLATILQIPYPFVAALDCTHCTDSASSEQNDFEKLKDESDL